jgi:hypothetical protein
MGRLRLALGRGCTEQVTIFLLERADAVLSRLESD